MKMKRINLVINCNLIIILTVLSGSFLFAQEETIYNLDDEIVVTASRIPTSFPGAVRSIVVISREEIELAPVQNIQDLLEYAAGVDVKQRGPNGVQADISIRGAAFEQTLILLDGVKISDPQTGHHNMDLPVSLSDVEKIEILKGQGSKLYGPNAFGGVINIITRKAASKQVSLKAVYGEHQLYDGTVSIFAPLGNTDHRLSFSKSGCDGYRKNTEFNILSASYGSYLKWGSSALDFLIGYTDKKFGANGFYSELYPNQWEHTKTTYIKTGLNLKGERFAFAPKIYWRRHNDDYILDREKPDWYHNIHTTDVYGVEFQSNLISKFGLTAIGAELSKEEIESNNLGNHNRTKGGLFFEHQMEFYNKLQLIAGAFAYNYSGWGWHWWPGVDLGCQINQAVKIYASIGQSFRVPTFTDLYYSNPSNQGNPFLKEEKAWMYELGLNFKKGLLNASLAGFKRDSENLIDWVKGTADSTWKVRNIAEVTVNGLEASLLVVQPVFIPGFHLNKIQLNYTFLDYDKNMGGFVSKYVLTHLRHQVLLGFEHNVFIKELTAGWKIRFEDRQEYDPHFLADIRILWKQKHLDLFLEATNLFNKSFSEIGSIPMPGRWIKMGFNYNLFAVD